MKPYLDNIKIYILSFFLITSFWGSAQGQFITEKEKPKELETPKRIIRTCCSFGTDVGVAALPFLKITEIAEPKEIGPHKYLGDDDENNGIVYTKRGGFIDLAHLRDCADWTYYLYNLITTTRENTGEFEMVLGREGGKKELFLHIPKDFSDEDAANLAGRIAYNLSMWHEIGTWYGTSYIPFVPERYSAFSPEDLYSNLLGANLGVEAIESDLKYEEAMSIILDKTLKELQVVESFDETYDAMESVKDDWWTRDKKLPSKYVLIKRYITADSELKPWLVGDTDDINPMSIYVPDLDNDDINDYYELRYNINVKFNEPGTKKPEYITQKDFPEYIEKIKIKLLELDQKVAKRNERKNKRKAKRS